MTKKVMISMRRKMITNKRWKMVVSPLSLQKKTPIMEQKWGEVMELILSKEWLKKKPLNISIRNSNQRTKEHMIKLKKKDLSTLPLKRRKKNGLTIFTNSSWRTTKNRSLKN